MFGFLLFGSYFLKTADQTHSYISSLSTSMCSVLSVNVMQKDRHVKSLKNKCEAGREEKNLERQGLE